MIRKYFLRIILQAHRKATITAGKFYNVNIVTFAQVSIALLVIPQAVLLVLCLIVSTTL